ncbi:Regulator of G-protein signaling 7 [Geranomyces variabilis]|nr:Regulator of G-protein signaling 7 [Geranomyces variabilis]
MAVSDRPAPARLTSLKKGGRTAAAPRPPSDDDDSDSSLPHQQRPASISSTDSKPVATTVYASENSSVRSATTSRPASPLVRQAQLYQLPVGYKPTSYDTHISRLLCQKPNRIASEEARWTPLEARRIRSVGELIMRLQDPETGVELKDRKKMFKVYANSFLGSDLLEWVTENCGLLGRDEGIRYCNSLFREGYIISVDLNDKFSADGSLYIFQTPYYWPQENWLPSDFDYSVFLLKRSMGVTSKYLLFEWEEERLYRLQDTYYEFWDRVENVADDHVAHMKTALSKLEARIFRLQEYTFWRVHRPVEGRHKDEKAVIDNKNNYKTEAAYESSLSDEALLAWLEKKVDYYNTNLSLNRIKVSYAAKTLVQRCDIWRNLDPMLEPQLASINPWVVEDPLAALGIVSSSTANLWLPKKFPTAADVRLWTFSFSELMRDPIGVKFFYDFVQKEFSQENLEFYLKCQALDAISTRAEFTKRAQNIYSEFIQIGAPRELNINSSDRNAIIAQFEALAAGNGQTELSYYVFADALKHILGLMAKDSYVRFCSSDVIEKALAEAIKRDASGGERAERKEKDSGKKTASRSSRELLTEQ